MGQMNARRRVRGCGAAGAALVLAAAGAAAGQCDWSVSAVPDFDQRRLQTSTVPGLPGDGGEYCVPTSKSNQLAYLANHGYPSLFGGARKWSNQANYDFVTSRILLLGNLIGTTPDHGSNPSGTQAGMTAYLLLFAPGKFDFTMMSTADGYAPAPADMWICHELGALVGQGWGRYTQDSPGHFTRSSGHATTVVGMTGFCGSGLVHVRYRNPADDDANTTQSPFATADSELTPIPAFFRRSASLPYLVRTQYRFHQQSPDDERFLDSVSAIWPLFGITTGNGGGGGGPPELRVQRPNRIFADLPAIQTVQTPTGGAIRDLAMSARLTSWYYITGPVGSTPAKVFKLDSVALTSSEITGFSNPTRVFCGRMGELYVLDGATLSWLEPEGPPSSVGHGGSAASMGIDCFTYDDAGDTVVGLDVAGRMVYVWSRLLGGPTPLPVPPGPCLSGRSSISISQADGTLWLCSAGCPNIYKLTGGGTGALVVADMITPPAGSNPTGVHVNTAGHVFFSSGGVLHEMEKMNGVWIDSPGSDFAGIPSGAAFCMSRSRSNSDSTMAGPEWYDTPDPVGDPETLDCYANCDNSTIPPVLNVNDFLCFINKFAAADPDANCDDSTVPPVLNVNDFGCFINKFAGGCP